MKKSILLLFFLSSFLYSRSQVYAGYQICRFTPGLENTAVQLHLYNQLKGTNFNYINAGHGVVLGVRGVVDKMALDINWNNKHWTFKSSYVDTTNGNELIQIEVKNRLNNLSFGVGVQAGPTVIYFSSDVGFFNVLYRKNGGKWGDYWGVKPTALFKWFNTPNFSVVVDIKNFLRVYYQFPIGKSSFASRTALSFYKYNTSNIGVALILGKYKTKS